MTKLMEWLLAGFLIFGTWVAIITGNINVSSNAWYVKWFPVILVFLFGVYSVIVVLYRVFTFNNCEAAAIELRREIQEARADLISKGIQLQTTTTTKTKT